MTLAEKFAQMMSMTNGMEDNLRSNAVDEFEKLIVDRFEQDNFCADLYQDGSIVMGLIDNDDIGHLYVYKNAQVALSELNEMRAQGLI